MDLSQYVEDETTSLTQVNEQVFSQAGRNYPKKEIGKSKPANEPRGEKQKTPDPVSNGRMDVGEYLKEKVVLPKPVRTFTRKPHIDIKPVEKVRQEIQEIIDSLDKIRFDFSDIFDEEEDLQASRQHTFYRNTS